jgi:hypothetical protein
MSREPEPGQAYFVKKQKHFEEALSDMFYTGEISEKYREKLLKHVEKEAIDFSPGYVIYKGPKRLEIILHEEYISK